MLLLMLLTMLMLPWLPPRLPSPALHGELHLKPNPVNPRLTAFLLT
jgi:hypothetical protein